EDGIRDWSVTGVQTCALPISFIHYLLVSLRALSLRAFPVLRVFRLLSLSRLWWSWRVLRAGAVDRRETHQRDDQRQRKNTRSGSVQHNNFSPNKVLSFPAINPVARE